MAALRPGRVIPRERARGAVAVAVGPQALATTVPYGRVVPREVVDAHAQAEAVLEGARERARVEARAEAHAELAAAWLVLRGREEERAERDLERAIQLATLLAERLVGGALELDSARVVAMARAALAELRGARKVTIDANPLDADALRVHLEESPLPGAAVDVRVDPALARGALVVHTDLGTLDARLRPQLERLAQALRAQLRA